MANRELPLRYPRILIDYSATYAIGSKAWFRKYRFRPVEI